MRDVIKTCRGIQISFTVGTNSGIWNLMKKCHVFGLSARRPRCQYKMGCEKSSRFTEEKEFGVLMQNDLLPEKHINKIAGETYTVVH